MDKTPDWAEKAERLAFCGCEPYRVPNAGQRHTPSCLEKQWQITQALREVSEQAEQRGTLQQFYDYNEQQSTMAEAMGYNEAAKFHDAVRRTVDEFRAQLTAKEPHE